MNWGLQTLRRMTTMLALMLMTQGIQAADTAAHPSEQLALIKQRGTLIVGVKTDYAPFGMLTTAGIPEGFEHDLATNVAKRLGVSLTKVPVTGANRLQRLEEGVVDVVIATTGDTMERRKIATLVEPNYYSSGVTLFMRPDQNINDWSATRGKKVCATQGSYFNRAMAERFLLDLQMFNNARDAKLAVKDRLCIGYLFDNTAIHGDLQSSEWSGYKAPLPPQLVTPWAVAIASRERGTALERFLEDTLADWHRSGFLIDRERAWHLPPSPFLAEMHTLWKSVDAKDLPVCGRNAEGRWPEACRNRVFLNATDTSGLRSVGLWLKERTGMDLTFIYDSYDRSRFLLGLGTTVVLMMMCVLLSSLIGVLGAVLAEARIVVLSPITHGLAHIARMTPPLLLIYACVFGLSAVLMDAIGIGVQPIVAVVVCLSVYTGASVMLAFLDAANVLRGRDHSYRLRLANFNQVLPLASPPATAALINVSKATMVASAVAVPELLSVSTSIMADNGNASVMMNTLLITFFLLVFCATRALQWVDRKLRARGTL